MHYINSGKNFVRAKIDFRSYDKHAEEYACVGILSLGDVFVEDDQYIVLKKKVYGNTLYFKKILLAKDEPKELNDQEYACVKANPQSRKNRLQKEIDALNVFFEKIIKEEGGINVAKILIKHINKKTKEQIKFYFQSKS